MEYSGPQSSVKIGLWQEADNDLASSLEVLAQELTVLTNRLDPILTYAPDSVSDINPESLNSGSAVVDQLRFRKTIVEELIKVVRDLQQRIAC